MKAVTVFLLAMMTSAYAGLRWDNQEQTFTAKPAESTVIAKYRFTNAGTGPVTISSVQTSCGCTTATLTKKEYLPGESGEIEARFNVGGRVGHQEKAILVTTSDSPQTPAVLRLIVDIPESVKITPEMVYWQVGEAPEPKTIEVSVSDDSPAKIVSVSSSTPGIKATVGDALPAKKATIQVTPADTSHAERATLVIKMDYPAENPAAHYAYVRIK
ncbi:MAG: DUF1573 domain-containing protein [Verrucomicrobia bacterium]|nr:DUF1573 domain-containing protein [Verrucomicrobiota bacterium]